jgi:N-acetylglucosaminyldiphosphoundecaprenol N-acetyl-beta-D-mannosaminyltransferase
VTRRTNILGVQVSTVNMNGALDVIDGWIRKREAHYVCVTGVHGIMESYRKKDIRDLHNAAGLVVPDGMPLVWLSRLKGFRSVDRVYGPDLMLAVCERAAKRGYRHFFYGGGRGVAQLLANRLQSRFPGLNVAGVHSPPFRPLTAEEDSAVCETIRRSKANVVWVGISTPKQEMWMAQHLDQLRPAVLIGVGAAFDFHAGLKGQAPKWMMKSGLEWLFRLVQEPIRLGPRYLKNNPQFLGLIALQLLGVRLQSIDSGTFSNTRP